jgi:hypothetical protein
MFIAPLALLGMALFTFLGGEIVKLLWNWLLPPLFGWPRLGFWQALAMLALCRILFGGLGLHRGGGSNMRRRMNERWERMNPEQRERYRQRWREWCGFPPSGPEGTRNAT